LSGSEGQIRDILEIGSHEGRSAIFWLRHLPHSHVTCVDPWAESDVPSSGDVGVEGRFNRNLSPFADRLRKMKMKSLQAFAMLGDEGRSFDLIYIDGDHRRDAVMLDCLLSWQAVRPGGMLLFDDYVFHMTEDRHRPQIAIDTFLAWHPEASVLLKSGQIAFQKPSPYAAPPSPV
jgi:predicted O-methyltransferase YrrM